MMPSSLFDILSSLSDKFSNLFTMLFKLPFILSNPRFTVEAMSDRWGCDEFLRDSKTLQVDSGGSAWVDVGGLEPSDWCGDKSVGDCASWFNSMVLQIFNPRYCAVCCAEGKVQNDDHRCAEKCPADLCIWLDDRCGDLFFVFSHATSSPLQQLLEIKRKARLMRGADGRISHHAAKHRQALPLVVTSYCSLSPLCSSCKRPLRERFANAIDQAHL